MSQTDFDSIVSSMVENYQSPDIFYNDPRRHFPNKQAIIEILHNLQSVMFPRYFGTERPTGSSPEYYIEEMLICIESALRHQILEALLFRDGKDDGCFESQKKRAEEICTQFFTRLPELHRMLLKDVQAAYDGDPAASSKAEIIFSYPGFYAVFVHRIAHELYVQDVPLIPRIMSEYAHSETGVDINPGATIGEYFFIDHATGVVIGETTIIGAHVKIYQGVTLGALSTRAGQQLSGVKRHPTIEDDVTIYANACVLGGETVVGAGSVIAGSTFVTSSVPPNSRVSVEGQQINVRQAKARPESWEL